MVELPPPLLQVLILYILALSRDEIARKLGISQGEASARIKDMLTYLPEARDIEFYRPIMKALRKRGYTVKDIVQGLYGKALLERMGLAFADLQDWDILMSALKHDSKLQNIPPEQIVTDLAYCVLDYYSHEGRKENYPPLAGLPTFIRRLRTTANDIEAKINELANEKYALMRSVNEITENKRRSKEHLEEIQSRVKDEEEISEEIDAAHAFGFTARQIAQHIDLLMVVPAKDLEDLHLKYVPEASKEMPRGDMMEFDRVEKLRSAMSEVVEKTVKNPLWQKQYVLNMQALFAVLVLRSGSILDKRV